MSECLLPPHTVYQYVTYTFSAVHVIIKWSSSDEIQPFNSTMAVYQCATAESFDTLQTLLLLWPRSREPWHIIASSLLNPSWTELQHIQMFVKVLPLVHVWFIVVLVTKLNPAACKCIDEKLCLPEGYKGKLGAGCLKWMSNVLLSLSSYC